MHLSIVYLSPLTVLVTNGVLVSWSGGARTKTVAWQCRLSHFWRRRMMTMMMVVMMIILLIVMLIIMMKAVTIMMMPVVPH